MLQNIGIDIHKVYEAPRMPAPTMGQRAVKQVAINELQTQIKAVHNPLLSK
jgi:hypothetical protein